MIQKQLADQAIVTESKMLRDIRTGADVEVDIVIDELVGGINIAIGIECTAERRPATVEWVREMVGKHQDLPLNKTILVSKSGFTEEAIKKANAHSVEAITLDMAEHLDWQVVVRDIWNLTLGRFNLKFWAVRLNTINLK
ncbi:MAG: hypothetical protein A2Y97_06265 [Nitrospirae bacterium RBG_13_39_12]|nr:MAG: hypothetical protein A2Y97_06265 [Nitrospirae bacterium RBG_13_39_12]